MPDKDAKRTYARDVPLYELVDFANRLRTAEKTKLHDDGLDLFELFGALRQASDDIPAMLVLLRSQRRDEDAELVLEAVALSRPAIETADVAARLEEQPGTGEVPAPDTRTITRLVAVHRTPRDAADFIDRLADKHERVVHDVLTTAAECWRMRELARLQLALIAGGRNEVARTCVQHVLDRSGDEVYDLIECQRKHGILETSLVNEHLRETMTPENLALFVLACTAPDSVMEPESVLVDVIKKDQSGRDIDDVVRLYKELQARSAPALAGVVTTEVARRRDPGDLIRYVNACDTDRQSLYRELVEEVLSSRDGYTIGDMLLMSWNSKRSANDPDPVLKLVADQASVEILLGADRFLASVPQPRLAISLLRATLHGKPERFTPSEVAQLFAAICRHDAQVPGQTPESAHRPEGLSAAINHLIRRSVTKEEPNLIGIVRDTLRQLNHQFSDREDALVNTAHLAGLLVEVTRTPGIPQHVVERIRTDIDDAIWSRDSKRLKTGYARELRKAGGDDLALRFEQRNGSVM